ncbi:MAG: DUF995 domain-containing protein [Geminicoccaceae bacterium]
MTNLQRRFHLAGAIAAVGFLSSMISPALADMVKLTQSEAIAHISGNTETWTKGGGYYAADGTMQALWKGKESKGSWEVKPDGQVCMVVEMWGANEECHEYVNDEGVVKLVFEGKARIAAITAGNQLGSL